MVIKGMTICLIFKNAFSDMQVGQYSAKKTIPRNLYPCIDIFPHSPHMTYSTSPLNTNISNSSVINVICVFRERLKIKIFTTKEWLGKEIMFATQANYTDDLVSC